MEFCLSHTGLKEPLTSYHRRRLRNAFSPPFQFLQNLPVLTTSLIEQSSLPNIQPSGLCVTENYQLAYSASQRLLYMTANRTHHTPASVQSAGARSMLNLHDGHVPSLHLSLFVLHHVDGCLAAYHRYIQYYGLASSNNGNILMLQVGPTENCPTYHNLRHIISLVLSRTAHSYNFKIIAYHLFQML